MLGGSLISVATYLRSTYLSRMKLASSGLGVPLGGLLKFAGSFASQYRLPLTFPMALQNSTCRGSHVSRLTDRTCGWSRAQGTKGSPRCQHAACRASSAHTDVGRWDYPHRALLKQPLFQSQKTPEYQLGLPIPPSHQHPGPRRTTNPHKDFNALDHRPDLRDLGWQLPSLLDLPTWEMCTPRLR
jgi:hypothetical protein